MLLLTRLLFGGFGSNKGRRCYPKIHDEWHKRFEEKLASMNPEEEKNIGKQERSILTAITERIPSLESEPYDIIMLF